LLADAFQPRSALQESVDPERAGDGSGVITQVITGDGGTGKTQFAASVYRRALPGLAVAVWVEATTRGAIVAAYARAQAGTHPADAGGEGRDSEHDALAFLSWLETTDRAWMVVLDDVADPIDVQGLWPTGPTGRVLVTTRRRDCAMSGHGRTEVNVEVFTPGEATDFLTRRLAGSSTPDALEQAGELAADLGLLPLALAQASAVIRDDALTCAQYRDRFADRTRSLIDLFGPAHSGERYERTVATTWALAIDRADALPPIGLARRLLRFAAVLDPNGAPEAVYTTSAAQAYLSPGFVTDRADAMIDAEPVVTAEDTHRAMRNLHRLSLITHDPTAGERAVRMHDLAQRAALENLEPDALARTVRAAADALSQIWPEIDHRGGLTAALRANTAVLAVRHADALWKPGLHPVLLRAGISMGEIGQASAARDYLAKLAHIAEVRLGRDHPDTLRTRGVLARWRGEARDSGGAAAAFEQLLADMNRVLDLDHPDTLRTRADLAWWRGKAGDVAGAVAALEELLTDMRRVLGPNDPDTLRTRGQLARRRGKAGDPVVAVAALEELVTDMRRVLGPNDPDTLRTRGDLRLVARGGRGCGRCCGCVRGACHRHEAGAGPRPSRHPSHPRRPRTPAREGRGSGERCGRVRTVAGRPDAGAGPR
jgi:hypothetical protein